MTNVFQVKRSKLENPPQSTIFYSQLFFLFSSYNYQHFPYSNLSPVLFFFIFKFDYY